MNLEPFKRKKDLLSIPERVEPLSYNPFQEDTLDHLLDRHLIVPDFLPESPIFSPELVQSAQEFISSSSQFSTIPDAFLTEDFVFKMHNCLSNTNDNLKSKIRALKFITYLWYLLDNFESILTHDCIVKPIIDIIFQSDLTKIYAYPIRALENLVGIDPKKAYEKILFLEPHFFERFSYFLKCYTRDFEVNSGLGLAYNLLLISYNEQFDIWHGLIPIFRFHLMNRQMKNQILACKCIQLIINNQSIYEGNNLIDEEQENCIIQRIYEAFKDIKNYCPSLFDLLLQFRPKTIILEDQEMFESIQNILSVDNEKQLDVVINCIQDLLPDFWRDFYSNGFINQLIDIANEGKNFNKIPACLCLAHYSLIDQLPHNKIHELLETNLVENYLDLIDQFSIADMEYIFRSILLFLEIDIELTKSLLEENDIETTFTLLLERNSELSSELPLQILSKIDNYKI